MKYFVRVVSVLILLFYTVEGFFFAGLSGLATVKGIAEVPYVGGGTLDGSPTPILDGIGRGLLIFGILLMVVVFLLSLAEIFFLIQNYVKAIQNRSFRYYRFLSVIGLIAGVVNVIASLIILLFIINISFSFDLQGFLENFVIILFFANLFMEFWSLLNLLSSNQCVRDGL